MTLSSTSPPATTTDATDEETSTESSRASTPTPSPRSPFSSPSSSFPPSKSPSVSDSGVTHTIPNESTVTVTRHTTITRQLPSTTTDSPAPPPTTEEAQGSTSTFLSPTPPATNTSVPNGNTSQTPASGIDTGAVIGIAVGGVFAAAGLLVVLLWLWRRRRGRAAAAEETADGDEPALVDKSRLHDSIFGRRPTSASLPRHPTPRQASERGGYGYDPFAPFGGRADQPARTLPAPEPNTFEMDGRGIHVAELPGTAMTTANGRLAVDAERRGTRSVGAVKQRPSSDPRATLNYLPRVDGRPAYINQWSQYKMLAGDARTR